MRRKRGDGSVYLRGRIYWVKYSENGKPVCESTGSDNESEARLGEIVSGRFHGLEADRVTIRELAEDYLNDYRINGKKSLAKAERMVRRNDEDGNVIDSQLMVFFGSCKAHAVGTAAVKAYIAKRLESGDANATVNRELAALKRMFNLGLQGEKIHRKPYIPRLEENNVRTGFFEHGDFIAFREALPDYPKPVVTFAYYTGWRRSEILNLTWGRNWTWRRKRSDSTRAQPRIRRVG